MTTAPRSKGVHRIAVLWFHPANLQPDTLFNVLTPGFVSTRCTCGYVDKMLPLNPDWLGANIGVCPNVKSDSPVADAI
jgi:hypothetical protein